MIAEKYPSTIKVIKSNKIVQHGIYELNALEFKILHFFIGQIKADSKNYTYTIADIRKALKISKSGKSNQIIIDSILHLMKCYFCLKNGGVSGKSIAWFSIITIDKSVINLEFNNYAMPYISNIKSNYTAYNLETCLQFQSKYTMRLYEILKSWEKLATYNADLKHLKQQLNALNYTNFSVFNERILKKAVGEINEYSDIKVTYTPVKEIGDKKVKFVQFHINKQFSSGVEYSQTHMEDFL